MPRQIFKALKNRNFALFAGGAFVSNIGTWMQRTAQDWLVLTELTDHNAAAVGLVMALQFGPQLLCLPWTGAVADSFDKRKLTLVTQTLMGLFALALAVLTLSGTVELWHVYVLAFLHGCAAAFDIPARQAYVAELVPRQELPNAIGLNSASFNGARLMGPAAAGITIALVGTGMAFLLNAFSFVAVLISLLLLRPPKDLKVEAKARRWSGGLSEGLRYIWAREDLKSYLIMLAFIGAFGLNFPVFVSTMAVGEFGLGASEFGFLTSCLAVGTVWGALWAAGRAEARPVTLVFGAFGFAASCLIAALMPTAWAFGAVLVFCGMSAVTVMTTSMALMQLTTDPEMRGRVLAIRIAVTMGGTPVGAPIAGLLVDQFGPRWSMGLAVFAGLAAGAVGLNYVLRPRSSATPSAEPTPAQPRS